MNSLFSNSHRSRRIGLSCAVLATLAAAPLMRAQQPASKPPAKSAPKAPAPAVNEQLFDTPQQAADTLIEAAGKFDISALTQIFGPDGIDIVLSGEFAQDRKHAADFA